MQYCVYCGNELKCGMCTGGTTLGSSSVSCPLKKASVWVHVTDDSGANVPGVTVTCSGEIETTDKDGVASWGPMDLPPDEHTVILQALTDPLDKKYVLPSSVKRTVKVAPGEMSFAPFELPRWGKIQVIPRFAKGLNPVDVDVKIEVKAKGGAAIGTETTRVAHTFSAAPGEYEVHASLPGALGAHHITADKLKPVTLPSGGDPTVEVSIETVEVRIPEQDQTLDIVAAGKTAQELTVHAEVFPAPPGTLEWTALPVDLVEITGDPTPVGSTYSAKIKPLKPGEVTITAKYTNGGVASDTSKVKVRVLPTIEVAAPKVVAIRNATGATHPRIAVKIGTTAPFDGTARLTAVHPGGAIAVYDAAIAGNELAIPADISNLLLTGGQPLYLEAAAKSAGRRTTLLKLELAGGTVPFGDAAEDGLTVVELALEMYRDTEVLTVAPFYTSDVAAEFDAALPDAQQNVPAPSRPSTLDAAFTFPPKTFYGTHVDADADDRVVRFRVKPDPDPSPDELDPAEFDVLFKILSKNSAAITWGLPALTAGSASHSAGYKVKLQRQAGSPDWVSPYGRVFNIALKPRNWSDTHFVLHSLPPRGNNLDDGKQFGRILRVSTKVGAADLTKDFTLGGQPYARVPVRFLWVSDGAAAGAPETKMAFNKIHSMNQYWAGQGIEFVPDEPATPIRTVKSPQRTLLTLGEFTGAAAIADHDVSIVIHLTATPAGLGPTAITLPACAIVANRPMADAASDLQATIQSWVGAGALAGLTLTGTIYDIPDARAHLKFDLNLGVHDLSTGLLTQPLPVLGTRGPLDIEIKPVGLALDALAITRIEVASIGLTPDPSVDIFSPPVDTVVHDPFFTPPSAAFRHWIRTYSPAGKAYVTVLIESTAHADKSLPLDTLCQAGFCGLHDNDPGVMTGRFAPPMQGTSGGPPAQTLLNPGIWTDPHATMICSMRDLSFNMGSDDVQHEIGHALSALNHTINDPDWYYAPELLHTGSGKPGNATIRQTRNKIFLFSVIKQVGACRAAYIQLDRGYGGAVRDWIQTNQGTFVVGALDPTQPAW